MFNLPVIITPLRTYCMFIQVLIHHHLIEYLEKYIFLKIADMNSIFANVKSIIKLSRQHFFADVK